MTLQDHYLAQLAHLLRARAFVRAWPLEAHVADPHPIMFVEAALPRAIVECEDAGAGAEASRLLIAASR